MKREKISTFNFSGTIKDIKSLKFETSRVLDSFNACNGATVPGDASREVLCAAVSRD